MKNSQVVLRPVERTDLSFLVGLANDPVVRAQVGGWDWPLALAGQERWFVQAIDSDSVKRFLIENLQGKPVGLTGLWDINWHDRTASTALKIGGGGDLRRKGYGCAALTAIMEFAFCDVGLHKLWATILAFNTASYNLFTKKCGWREEGRLREHIWKAGRYHDLVQVGMLSQDYAAWASSQPSPAGGE